MLPSIFWYRLLAYVVPDVGLLSGLWCNKSRTELLEESRILAPWRVFFLSLLHHKGLDAKHLLEYAALLLCEPQSKKLEFAIYRIRFALCFCGQKWFLPSIYFKSL